MTPKINKAGIYAVFLYVNGVRTPVIIDDWLPCRRGKPAFAKSRKSEQELWVSLLEKAWAKLHKTCAGTQGGLPDVAAGHITG